MSEAVLTRDVRRYIARSYPHNHNYRILGTRTLPCLRLLRRYIRITALYPEVLESLVDLSVSKGYFVVEAASKNDRLRAMGIDVNETELEAAALVSRHLGQRNVKLLSLRLEELAQNIDAHGGRFQAALLINVYQYLFYGSPIDDRRRSHDEIFRSLHEICSHTLIFSNCVEYAQLPSGVQRMARAQGRLEEYTEDAIRKAAGRYFSIEDHGLLGKRPLWRLVPSAANRLQSEALGVG